MVVKGGEICEEGVGGIGEREGGGLVRKEGGDK